MLEITVLSGKGGTGKTSITAALGTIAKNGVFCDNDVDAADLHLLFHPEIKEKHTFVSSVHCSIDRDICDGCGLCSEHCRFDAISKTSDNKYVIDPLDCEGCRLCEHVCPAEAITSIQNDNNYWFVSNTRFGDLVHAKIGPGEENSGKLVSVIRQRAKEVAKEKGASYIINDGPPGIGCAAIASLTGTGRVLIVIEPSKSGFHDAIRLISLIEEFNIPKYAIINKYDLNMEISQQIERYLHEKSIPLFGKIIYDVEITKAMVSGKTIIEHRPESDTSKQLYKVWELIKEDSKTQKIF